MKVYLLKDSDFAALIAAIDRDPSHGVRGGSSAVLTEGQRRAHEEAHRFFNYQVRTWIDSVKGES
jgi:hypothetical protein